CHVVPGGPGSHGHQFLLSGWMPVRHELRTLPLTRDLPNPVTTGFLVSFFDPLGSKNLTRTPGVTGLGSSLVSGSVRNSCLTGIQPDSKN
ncbi:MAG: hypothetical protein ACKO3L_00870, partial [Actinomycetota bacterium]